MITGSVQVNKGYFFLVFNVYNEFGKRVPEWHSTGIKITSNKRKNVQLKKQAEKMLSEELIRKNTENNFSNKFSSVAKNSKPSNLLFCDYMLEWLGNKKPKIAQTTYIGYEQVITKRMYQYFKKTKVKLIDLKPKDLQDFINYLYKQNLKGSTIQHYLANIGSALEEAVIAEVIPSNPTHKIEAVKKEEYIPNFYTDSQLIELIEVVKNENQSLPITLGIIYGLRREEVLGLTWKAIDFQNKTITISRTVGRGKYDGKTQFLIKDIPKNKSSYRTLPLFDFISDLLYKTMEQYKENERLLGNSYIQDYKQYICLMENGDLVKPAYLGKAFSKILKKYNFDHIRLHDLRHSCATLLLRNGVALSEIQKWLGHSNITTTQRYSHLDKSDKSIPANLIMSKFNMSFDTNKN